MTYNNSAIEPYILKTSLHIHEGEGEKSAPLSMGARKRITVQLYDNNAAPEGMTGSPVVGMKNDRMKLLGVYSDSSTAEFAANAGLVWDSFLVKELIGAS